MRVLVVPKWYPWPDRPVLGIFCREQARALSAGHDVVVLASDAVRSPDFPVFRVSEAVEGGLRTIRVRYRRPRFRPAAMACQLAGMLAALLTLRRRGWRPEIVHAHVYSAGLPALVLGRLSRAPVIVSEHFTGFQRGLITGYDRLVARIAFRGADLVAPVSEDLARYVLMVEPRARVRVVENVVDTEVFHPPTPPRRLAPDGSARLLNVAAFAPKKAHADLLAALAELRARRDLVLDLVGEGDLRSDVEARARELGLDGAVRFLGERPIVEVAELMRRADLFVLPSIFENLPCVLIESLASGLPFVATAVGGVPELANGPGAVLIPPGDPHALAAAIERALDGRPEIDPQTLAERARSRFGSETFERNWTAIYGELRAGTPVTARTGA